MKKTPYHLKIVNAGDGGTGKTTFLKRYTTGQFVEDTIETIGTGFFTKNLLLNNEIMNNEIMNLTIWDLGGQERFRHIVADFMMGAAGALLFFDLTRYTTFENLNEWIAILRKANDDDETLPIMLVGAKSDLEGLVEVNEELILKFVKDNDLIGYYTTSSKTGQNIEESMEFLVKYIFKKNKGIF